MFLQWHLVYDYGNQILSFCSFIIWMVYDAYEIYVRLWYTIYYGLILWVALLSMNKHDEMVWYMACRLVHCDIAQLASGARPMAGWSPMWNQCGLIKFMICNSSMGTNLNIRSLLDILVRLAMLVSIFNVLMYW